MGFGSWGIALAQLLHANGHTVLAWDANKKYTDEISRTRVNEYLPGVKVAEGIQIIHEPCDADVFVIAAPSRDVEAVAQAFAPFLRGVIVTTTKGLCRGGRISQVFSQNGTVVALSGPSHAEEVHAGIPTAVVAASECEAAAKLTQELFSSATFRVYTSADIAGAELGGAIKNVIAIAAGTSDGLGFGDNTKAALITRGISEITRLGVALGADARTFGGLSGIGDLIVTCTSKHSRNWQVGHALAQGEKLADILSRIGATAEGVATAQAALELAQQCGVQMPIVEEVCRVLFEGKAPLTAVTDLMMRELKVE